MEANLHNLTVAVGAVNAARSNFNFGMVSGLDGQFGACRFKVDSSIRTAEPPEEIRGFIARTYFYMFDRYGLNMSSQQERLLRIWHQQHPPSSWEIERNNRVATRMGHHNEFVTGQRVWTEGYRPRGDGIYTLLPDNHPVMIQQQSVTGSQPHSAQTAPAVRGNRSSRIYHLPVGCPSFETISDRNRIDFPSEAAAIAAGYRKAGNCR
jgi:deoxyribonuclease-1